MNFDALIVFSYLLLTLFYGVYVGRGVKTIKEYAVGNRKFTTSVLAATIIATYASSSGFNIDVTKGYEDGLLNMLSSVGMIVCLLLLAHLIAPRMREFLGTISVCEMIGCVYGRVPRIISSVFVFVESAGHVAIQVKVLSSTLVYFVNIDPVLSLGLTTAVITLYSAFGGIKAVTLTDVIQFATFSLVIPVTLLLVWGSSDILNDEAKTRTFISHITSFDSQKLESYKILFLYLMIPNMNASTVQRMLMAKSTAQIKDSFIIAAKFLFVILLLSNLIGYVLYLYNPNLSSGAILPYLIDKFSYPGMKGLFLIGILAMAMSTADSKLNAGAVCFSHDFCSQIKYLKNLNQLLVSKVFSLVIGGCAFFLALYFHNIISIILFVGSFYASVITVPVLLALFGFRSSTRAVLVGMSFGILTILGWNPLMNILQVENPMGDFIPGILAHMIGLFTTHYFFKENGGWRQGPGSGIFNNPDLDPEYYPRSISTKSFIYENFCSISKFIEFLKNNLPQSVFLYNKLAIYCSSLSLLYFMYQSQINGYDAMIFLGSLICSFSLVVRNLIDDEETHILLPLYMFATTYCFPFFSTYILIRSNFSALSVVIATLSLFVMQLLMSTRFASFSTLIGSLCGIIVSSYINSFDFVLDSILSSSGLIILGFISISSVKYLISDSNWKFISQILVHNRILKDKNLELDVRVASREDSIKKLYNLKSEIMNNFSHEIKIPLHATGNFLDTAIEKSIDFDEVNKSLKLAKKSFEGLSKYILKLADLSDIQSKKMLFEMQNADLMDILQSLKDDYQDIIDINLYCRRNSTSVILCDVIKIKSAFKELIENSIQHAKANFIEIIVKPQEDKISIEFSDMPGKQFKHKISGDRLFEPFEVSKDSTEGYKGLGLALVKEIICRHAGNIDANWRSIDYGFDAPDYAPRWQLIFNIEFEKNTEKSVIKDKKKKGRKGHNSLKFLLVDDDENILKSTSLILEAQGHSVHAVAGGIEAINFVEAGRYEIDILLLDIMMPDKNGFEVLEALSDILEDRNIKTIIQSGISSDESYKKYINKHKNLIYCPKPYKIKDLNAAIESVL